MTTLDGWSPERDRAQANGRTVPLPTSHRFKPLRLGILNVWEYDDQEFWPADGRLILRGHNTAGKSKALELLLPFVLDGETRPERLDPFGGQSKTMYWNLIDFDPDRNAAIGYCWVELGRIDEVGEPAYVTVLVGMRGQRSAGRKVDTWFAVTPQRVGVDLDLAPNGQPLPGPRLRDALGADGVFTTTAREHRAAVDDALFGLGSDRYDSLLHLLLQLRRPKLSEKLDLARLGAILTDALPPLDQRRVESLAEAFTKLDAQRERVEQLEAAHAAVVSFLDPYRHYARLQTRLRSDGVRSANSRLDKVTETERLQRASLDDATRELGEVDAERAAARRESAEAKGSLDALDLSKVVALEEVREKARALEHAASSAEHRATQDRAAASAAADRSSASSAVADAAVAARDALAVDAGRLAAPAGLGTEHDAHVTPVAAEADSAADAWDQALRAADAAASRSRSLLVELRAADRAAAEVRAKLDQAETKLAAADDARADATDERDAAVVATDDAADAFVADAAGWLDDLDTDVAALLVTGDAPATGDDLPAVDDQLHAQVHEELHADVLAADDVHEARRSFLAHLADPGRRRLRDDQSRLAADRARLDDEAARLTTERTLVLAEQDDAPTPGPGRPAARLDGAVPLWACTDFAADLGDGDRAGLEAALAAAGLLDALVTPDGRLVTADEADTVVAPTSPAGASLARWLQAVPDPDGPVDADAVRRALAGIGAGVDTGSCWVDVDGAWANGPLRGRWTVESASFIGASARADARRRRLEALDAALASVAEQLGDVDRRLADLDDLRDRFEQAADAFPAVTAVADARRDARQADVRLQRALAAVESAAAVVETQRAVATDRLAALERAAAAARCAPGDVDEVLDAVDAYARAIARLTSEARRAASEVARAAQDAELLAAAVAQLAGSEAEHARAAEHAARARAEAVELEQVIGAEVAEVVARADVLRGRIDDLEQLDLGLAERRDLLLGTVAAARSALEATAQDRVQRDAERVAALEGLDRLARTELAHLAFDAPDDGRDLQQVSAGLAFARAAHDALRDVEIDQAAQDRAADRLHKGYQALRSTLGAAYDPQLDTVDGMSLCFTNLNNQAMSTSELDRVLGAEAVRGRAMLTDEERDAIERHLLTEVGAHLAERVHDAWALVQRMNDQLAAHPTRSGVSLRLRWEAAETAGPGAEGVLGLLRRGIGMLNVDERGTLSAFLAAKVAEARDDESGGDVVERLVGALDYRAWHRFTLFRRAGDTEQRLTNRTQATGSGGEQAKLAHLPLFAATSAYYSSARPTAPHLLLLDEAFAGIDDAQRGDCMGMLVDLDLDLVCTNYAEWGCYPEVPAVATYHLDRTPGVLGVTALRFVWDGVSRREDDPFLASVAAAAADAATARRNVNGDGPDLFSVDDG